MTRRFENKRYKGEFIPDLARLRGSGKQKQSQTQRGRQPELYWRGESDTEESLSDPRSHRRTSTTTYEC